MFSGIIQDIGTIASTQPAAHGCTLTIATSLPQSALQDGASIACNGVCLTATGHNTNSFSVDVSHETLSCTTIASWQDGSKINLEPALKLGDPLDGHLVFGHVDGLGKITKITDNGGSKILDIRPPSELLPLIAQKGSISLDGTSLTINSVQNDIFQLTIIPHSLKNTIIQHYCQGQPVHLEADMLARYVQRILHLEN